MKLEATKVTAAVSGVWSALGIATFGTFWSHVLREGATGGVIFALVMLVFFFGPFFVFVVGVRMRGTSFGAHMWGFVVRGVCWILGASAVAMPLVPFLSWLKSH